MTSSIAITRSSDLVWRSDPTLSEKSYSFRGMFNAQVLNLKHSWNTVVLKISNSSFHNKLRLGIVCLFSFVHFYTIWYFDGACKRLDQDTLPASRDYVVESLLEEQKMCYIGILYFRSAWLLTTNDFSVILGFWPSLRKDIIYDPPVVWSALRSMCQTWRRLFHAELCWYWLVTKWICIDKDV